VYRLLPSSRKPKEISDISKSKKIGKDSQDVIELIKKLAELHIAGILTDDEFSSKKSELLGKI